jgi:hypothetical protein
MCGIRLQADYGRLKAGRDSFETTPGVIVDSSQLTVEGPSAVDCQLASCGSALRLIDLRAFGILRDGGLIVGNAVLVKAGVVGTLRTGAVLFLRTLAGVLISRRF